MWDIAQRPAVGPSLAKRAIDLIGEGLHQIRHYGPIAGLYEGLDRHAGDEFDGTKSGDLVGRQCHPVRVVALVRALLGADVG